MPFVSCKILSCKKLLGFATQETLGIYKCGISVCVNAAIAEISVVIFRKFHRISKGTISLPFFPFLSQNTNFSVDAPVSVAK